MEISALPPACRHARPDAAPDEARRLVEASQQFESILLRQFLSESMKPMLEGGPSGQVYGYLLTDALAYSLSQEGGLGLSHVLQTQLGGNKKP